MFDEAYKIFDYLPVQPGGESRYINQLWGVFNTLQQGEDDIPHFSIVPFHLLFMLAIQYKIYRFAGFDPYKYVQQIAVCKIYGKENKEQVLGNIPINKNSVWDTNIGSVKTFSLVNEKSLFDIFDPLGMNPEFKKQACYLVDNRNDRLHANGEVDELAEQKVGQYFEILNHLQEIFSTAKINQHIQGNWSEDLNDGEYPIDEFLDEKFLYSQFSPLDYGDVLLEILLSENLDFDQWIQFVEKGIELCPEQTQGVLKNIILQENIADEIKFNAQKILDENF